MDNDIEFATRPILPEHKCRRGVDEEERGKSAIRFARSEDQRKYLEREIRLRRMLARKHRADEVFGDMETKERESDQEAWRAD